jgi:hypothetical protein
MRYCFLCLFLLLCRFPLLAAGSNYETNLPNFAAFKILQGEPLTLKFGGVTAVKVVLGKRQKKQGLNKQFWEDYFNAY